MFSRISNFGIWTGIAVTQMLNLEFGLELKWDKCWIWNLDWNWSETKDTWIWCASFAGFGIWTGIVVRKRIHEYDLHLAVCLCQEWTWFAGEEHPICCWSNRYYKEKKRRREIAAFVTSDTYAILILLGIEPRKISSFVDHDHRR
jgi:hypothetical protein